MKRSLLQNITSQDIDDLILEHEFISENYNVHYFIDEYDINKYCFPFGLIADSNYDKRQYRPIEIITDEQIAYHSLFNLTKEKFILFNEQQIDYQSFIEAIKRAEYYGLKLVDSFQELVEHFNKLEQHNHNYNVVARDLSNISEYNVSLLLSIALGSLGDGKQKANYLSTEKLVSRIEDLSIHFNDSLGSDIDSCQPGELTDFLFDKLTERNDRKLSESIKLSRYNRCKVFDRLINLNKRSMKNGHFYFLISSAATSTYYLPNIAYENNLFPTSDNGQILNPIRSIQQVFLKMILDGKTYLKDELEKLNIIVKLKEQVSNERIRQSLDGTILDRFESNLSTLRDRFENSSLLLQFPEYSEIIEAAMKSRGISRNAKILEAIKFLIEAANNKDELLRLKSIALNQLQLERDYNTTLILATNSIYQGIDTFEISAGEDYVTNAYHHLPLVYFTKSNSNYQKIVDKITQFLTVESPKDRDSRALIASINGSLSFLFHSALPNNEEEIIKILILLMLPRTNDIKPDYLAFSKVKEVYENDGHDKQWEIMYLYLLSWIARRINKYESSITYAEKGMSIDINDPRFNHSLCLTLYCCYKESNEKEYLSESIDNNRLALEKYANSVKRTIAVDKSIIALKNSLSFLLCELFNYDSIGSYLVEARGLIDEIKRVEGPRFTIIPEFLHTEAYLEVREFKAFKDSKKLGYALNTINKAITLYAKQDYINLKLEILRLQH